MSNYHIIYTNGNRRNISVVEIVEALSYELSDYAVASRESFRELEEACKYARKLAIDNGLDYIAHDDEDDFLD